jgi:acyl-CoA synthetase (AMP-forming)/AMP-acid ligase II
MLSESIGENVGAKIPSIIIYDWLQDVSRKQKDDIALVCMHQPSSFLSSITNQTSTSNSPYLRWSYGQLQHASHVFAASLYAAGIRPGMRILSFLGNGVEHHVALWAALELNCTFAPLNAKVGGNRGEARHVMGMLEPSVVLVSDPEVASKLEDYAPEKMVGAKVRLISPSPEKTIPGWEDFSSFAEKGIRKERVLEGVKIVRKPEDPIMIFATSGTTAQPKGCPYTNKNFSAIMRGHHQRGDFATEPHSRIACCHVPISHIFGLNYSTECHLAGPRVVHPSAAFHPTSTWDAIRLERCSEIPGVPVLIPALIAHPACKTTDRSCLKHVHMGSSTILPETIRICIEELGCGRASEAYGMTETGPAILHSFRDLPLQVPEIVTAGRIHPEAKIWICKPDTREVVERGVPGECHVGGDVVVTEYWRGDGKMGSEGFYTDEEGTWIVTGDQAIMDLNGELRVAGRYKDLIIRRGVNISVSWFTGFLYFCSVFYTPDPDPDHLS